MKLENVAKIYHGSFLSRIRSKTGVNTINYELFTMQDLSFETGYSSTQSRELSYVDVDQKQLSNLQISSVDDVIIGLSLDKAYCVTEKHANKVIPSNFVIVKFDLDKVDPNYFAWYFNEHSDIKKQMSKISQGSVLSVISIQMLRDIEIFLPDLDVQVSIGKVYSSAMKKKHLLHEKEKLQFKLFNKQLSKSLENKV